MNNKPVDQFHRIIISATSFSYRLRPILDEQVFNVRIVKLKQPPYGDEIVRVNRFVMHVVYILNFIM